MLEFALGNPHTFRNHVFRLKSTEFFYCITVNLTFVLFSARHSKTRTKNNQAAVWVRVSLFFIHFCAFCLKMLLATFNLRFLLRPGSHWLEIEYKTLNRTRGYHQVVHLKPECLIIFRTKDTMGNPHGATKNQCQNIQ